MRIGKARHATWVGVGIGLLAGVVGWARAGFERRRPYLIAVDAAGADLARMTPLEGDA